MLLEQSYSPVKTKNTAINTTKLKVTIYSRNPQNTGEVKNLCQKQ